ncbi:MAG: response regulator [Desulfobulbus sp.]|nr:response regulator [Desulfobulbus sp.]
MEQEAVLIVDDEELIRETLRLDLLEQGYAVDAVASGEEALELLEKNYGLIITDLLLEGINGLEVLRLAKELQPERAVFILTGHRELEAAIGALRLGADDYLIKPYTHGEMISRVASCLQERAARRARRSADTPILSICSDCKKIRSVGTDSKGASHWVSIEHFISQMLDTELSHGICPDCYQQKMAELTEMIRQGQLVRRS